MIVPNLSTTSGPLVFQLSGGTLNTSQALSLGGEPSLMMVSPTIAIDNLFADLSDTLVADSTVDYRAIYVFNDGTFPISQIQAYVYLSYAVSGSSTVALGVATQNEIQQLSFTGYITGGTFTITLDGNQTGPIPYMPDADQTAAAIQAALQLLPNAAQAVVEATGTETWAITFQGDSGNRGFPLMTANVAGLTYYMNQYPPTATVIELQPGQPVNSIAPLIVSAVVPPLNVAFAAYSAASPLEVGYLNPSDGFPLWLRRTVSTAAPYVEQDGIVLAISGYQF